MKTMAAELSYQASPGTLARASLAATVGAAAILTFFVLPAEWGIDPTGVGKTLKSSTQRPQPPGS
jgi:hypothetical protein